MKISIKTPDQRLRVFVSSTLQELSEERNAVKEAILTLQLIPVMFELGARPYPPRDLYTAYLQQSHVFIGIYWQQYGWVAPDMSISGLEDELRLSLEMPRLIYIKEPAPERTEGLKRMIIELQSSGISYKTFKNAEELNALVLNDLAVLITERFEMSIAEYQMDLEADKLNEQFPFPATPLIGREKEMKQLIKLLNSPDIRLITLTGTGGIGKTRLALELLLQLKNRNEYSVCFVSLSSIDQAKSVADTILHTAFPLAQSNLPAKDLLIDLINERKLLFVLDNFEHVIEARLLIAELLKHCPHLKFLITSRELLYVSGEYEFTLYPLKLGREDLMPDPDDLSPAIELFVQRSKNIHPDFRLSGSNYHVIHRICTQLDGIPLAIELAAARTRLFSPKQILQLINKSLDVLKGGTHDMPARHQALKATIDWSYMLLNGDEQRLLCMLSVFSGGCTLEAAAAIYSCHSWEEDVWNFPRYGFYKSESPPELPFIDTSDAVFLDALESLLSKSLAFTSVNRFGSLRINFYQTIRQYSLEQLRQTDIEEKARRKHFMYFLHFVEQKWCQLKSDEAEEAYEAIENDIHNIETALQWSLETAPDLGLRIVIAMAEYWDTRGRFAELRKWIELLMEKTPELKTKSVEIWCMARLEFARALFRLSEYQRSWEEVVECFEMVKERKDKHLETDIHIFQSLINVYSTRNERKEELIQKGLDLARRLNYRMALLDGIQHKAADRIFNGPIEEGIQLSLEGLELSLELKAKRWEAISNIFLGFGYTKTASYDRADQSFFNALDCARSLNDQLLPVYSLLGLSHTALARQEVDRALILLGAVESFINRPGTALVPIVHQIFEDTMSQLVSIPTEMREALLKEGRKLKINDAIQMALQPSHQLIETSSR